MLTIKTKTKEYKNISNPKDDIRSEGEGRWLGRALLAESEGRGMKCKKINKAIKTIKKFCESQPDGCSKCPFMVPEKDTFVCSFENLPIHWLTIKEIQKAREEC